MQQHKEFLEKLVNIMKRNLIIISIILSIIISLTACGASEYDSTLIAGNNTASVDQSTAAGNFSEVPAFTTNEEKAAAGESRYMNITPEEAKKRIDSGEKIILLDVRTKEEYEEKRIPDSSLIPVEVIEQEALSKLTDKAAIIFVYCRSGSRSIIAAEILTKLGYTKVYNLGGIIDWPYETISGR